MSWSQRCIYLAVAEQTSLFPFAAAAPSSGSAAYSPADLPLLLRPC